METKKKEQLQKKINNLIGVKSLFKKYSFTLGACVVIYLVIVISLSIAYLTTFLNALVTAILVWTCVFAAVLLAGTLLYYHQVKHVYLDEMYNKTKQNFEALASQKRKLVRYDSKNIQELNEFNKYIDTMDATFQNITLCNFPLDYSKYELERPDPNDPFLITTRSFTLNIRNFILSCESFRNAVIFFNIDHDPLLINDSDYKLLIENINKYLPMDNKIYAISTNRGGVLVFVPDIDSISFMEEAIHKIIDESVIYDYHPTGVDIIKVRGTMAVYPYSNIDDILDDLRYADRQGKKVNIYLPDRLNKHNDNFNHSTLFLNNMTKIFLEYNKIPMTSHDTHDAIRKVCNLMKNVRVNLGFESCGTIIFEEFSKKYYCTFDNADKPENEIFGLNNIVSSEFIEMLEEVSDEDHSYFFSFRNRASDKIGRFLDAYGIRSGHFYVIHNADRIRGVVFFANKFSDLYLNNYSRETLFVFCTYLGSFSKELQDKKYIDASNTRVTDILRLSEIDMYTIEKENYALRFVSDALADSIGHKVKIGNPCYKELYGLDEPCEKCPLKTSRKMLSELNKVKCTTSNVLTRRRSPFSTMVLTHDKNAEWDTNRFHPELFVFSCYSLVERMNGLYKAGVRGTLVLLSIDNAKDLVKDYGDEGYFLRVRTFINAIQEQIPTMFEIYSYNDNTLAIIFCEEGRVDVVKNCEAMFEVSQHLIVTGIGEFSIDPTFLVFDFPLDKPTPVEFTRYVNRYIKENKQIFAQKNKIVIAGSNYVRDASREAFLLSVLESAFERNTLHTKLLPIIGYDDKNIVGAEMLLRVTDEYLGVGIPAIEFINAATRHGHISRISNYLIDYMGKVYQKYGVTIFKTAGFRYFSINTETSYLKDENFLFNIGGLLSLYHLPKDFLCLEITEKDLADNFDFYKSIYKRVLSYNIVLVADNYTGNRLSLDKLKEIGVTHVKVSRSIISMIDKDVHRFNEVREGLIDCAEEGMKVCLVGIENKEQHTLLGEYKNDFYRQGYYYGEPVDIEELINKLKMNYMK